MASTPRSSATTPSIRRKNSGGSGVAAVNFTNSKVSSKDKATFSGHGQVKQRDNWLLGVKSPEVSFFWGDTAEFLELLSGKLLVKHTKIICCLCAQGKKIGKSREAVTFQCQIAKKMTSSTTSLETQRHCLQQQ